MRQSFAIIVFLVTILASAQTRAQTPLGAPSQVNWTGPYAGAHIAWGRADFDSVFDSDEIDFPTDFEDSVLGSLFELDGITGGLQLGYDQQFGSIVIGIEGDWTFMSWNDFLFDPELEDDGTDNADAQIRWLVSLRGRIGLASSRSLLFLTAGIAWADMDYTACDCEADEPEGVNFGSINISTVGYVVGGGIEHLLRNNVSVRLEGLYYDFNEREDTQNLNFDSNAGDFAELENIAIFRLSANYRFNIENSVDPASHQTTLTNWSGFHIGGFGGWGQADLDGLFDSSSIGFPPEFDDSVQASQFDLEGFAGGVIVGYDQRFENLVIGIEGDWAFMTWSDLLFDPEPEADGTDRAEADVNWITSIRGRAGIVSGQTLFFATAGIAWANADYLACDCEALDVEGINLGAINFTSVGAVVGGGIEHLLTDNLSLRLEGLYYAFDDREDTQSLTTDSDPGDFIEIDDIVVFRVGGSYRLP